MPRRLLNIASCLPTVRFYRLIALTLAGGHCGLAAVAIMYGRTSDTMGYSVAEYQRWSFVGLIAGAFIGVGTELAIRFVQRRNFRFSIREFLLAFVLIAVGLVIVGGLVKWADPNSHANRRPNHI